MGSSIQLLPLLVLMRAAGLQQPYTRNYTMFPNNINALIDRVVSVIQELKEASASEIKRKILAFHKEAGGAEELQKILTELLSTGRIIVRTEKKGNGQLVESYCLAHSNDPDNGNRSVDTSNSGINPRISVQIDIVFEDWQEIFSLLSSLINTNNVSNEHNVESSEVDDEDSYPYEYDHDLDYDTEDSCHSENDNDITDRWLDDHMYKEPRTAIHLVR
jgi:hypothetical protein